MGGVMVVFVIHLHGGEGRVRHCGRSDKDEARSGVRIELKSRKKGKEALI